MKGCPPTLRRSHSSCNARDCAGLGLTPVTQHIWSGRSRAPRFPRYWRALLRGLSPLPVFEGVGGAQGCREHPKTCTTFTVICIFSYFCKTYRHQTRERGSAATNCINSIRFGSIRGKGREGREDAAQGVTDLEIAGVPLQHYRLLFLRCLSF